MSKVEPLKAGLRASAADDWVYGMEKWLWVQCLSLTMGARFWYMSSTASMDTWNRRQQSQSWFQVFMSPGSHGGFEGKTCMFRSISWLVSKSSSSSPNGLIISSPTCRAETGSASLLRSGANRFIVVAPFYFYFI